MQLPAGDVNALKNTNSHETTAMPFGVKKGQLKPVSEAWLAFDTETEQEVAVEQPQLLKQPFLGPLETTLLAGLIVATLARHLVRSAP